MKMNSVIINTLRRSGVEEEMVIARRTPQAFTRKSNRTERAVEFLKKDQRNCRTDHKIRDIGDQCF